VSRCKGKVGRDRTASQYLTTSLARTLPVVRTNVGVAPSPSLPSLSPCHFLSPAAAELKDLIKDLLQKNPQNRLTAVRYLCTHTHTHTHAHTHTRTHTHAHTHKRNTNAQTQTHTHTRNSLCLTHAFLTFLPFPSPLVPPSTPALLPTHTRSRRRCSPARTESSIAACVI